MTKIDAPNVVLVEGPEDLHAIAGLLRRHKLTQRLEGPAKGRLRLRWNHGATPTELDLVAATGIEQVKDFNKTLAAMDVVDAMQRVALIIDADENAQSRWEAIANRLNHNGYTVPASPNPTGTIVASPARGKARVGVWIMPDNSSAGMLETFFQYAIPEDSGRLWQTAESAVGKIRADFPEENRFKTAHLDKAKMHTYLAWRDPPGAPIGQAVVKGLLSHDSDQTVVFLQWLSETLELPLAPQSA